MGYEGRRVFEMLYVTVRIIPARRRKLLPRGAEKRVYLMRLRLCLFRGIGCLVIKPSGTASYLEPKAIFLNRMENGDDT